MFKASARTNQESLIVLGLSHQNLDRLKEGKPIAIEMSEFGYSQGKILIFSGETEQAMANEMREFIGPDTEVRIGQRPNMGGRPRKGR